MPTENEWNSTSSKCYKRKTRDPIEVFNGGSISSKQQAVEATRNLANSLAPK